MKYFQRSITDFAKQENSSSSSSSEHTKASLAQVVLDNQDIIKPDDTIQIKEVDDDHCYGVVLRMWKDEEGKEMAEIQWYYKPKDIFQTIPAFIGRKELFISDHVDYIPVDSIIARAEIVSIDAYFFNRRSDSTYFSRASYRFLEHELDPPFLQWPTICTCGGVLNPDLSYLVCAECFKVFHHQCVRDVVDQVLWYCRNCRKRRSAGVVSVCAKEQTGRRR